MLVLVAEPAPLIAAAEPPPSGPTRPALVWTVALLALVSTGALSIFAWSTVPVGWWAGIGFVGSLAILPGIRGRHGLAYRYGLVIAPLGATAVLVSLFVSGPRNDSATLVTALFVAALGLVTPLLWCTPGVKRYFRLRCPNCGGMEVAAESFTFSVRRCRQCGAIFSVDDEILRPGATAVQLMRGAPTGPPTDGPEAAGTSSTASPPVAPTAPATAAALPSGYALDAQGRYIGPAGRSRDLGWFVVCGFVLTVLGIVTFAIVGMADQETSDEPSAAELTVTAILSCTFYPALLAMWIYWLVWVYRTHDEIRRYTWYEHPVSAAKALGFCFIPLFNLFWVIYMPYRLAETVAMYQGRGGVRISPNRVLTYQILAVVPGQCLPGLSMLFYGLSMEVIQRGLNALWAAAGSREIAPAAHAGSAAAATAPLTGAPPAVASPADSFATGPQPAGTSVPQAAPPDAVPVTGYPGPLPRAADDATTRMLLPVGRSAWAIAAGYLGLFSVLIVIAPIALVISIIAVRDLRKNPHLHGWGRAVFGLIMGALGTLGMLLMIASGIGGS
jgi:hypothetical protein